MKDNWLVSLKERFNKELYKGQHRRLVFWHDPKGESRSIAEEFSENLYNVKYVELTNHNQFETKKLLCLDDPLSDYLIYCPEPIKDEDNLLLDMMLYSKHLDFSIDAYTAIADEITVGIENSKVEERFRKYVKGPFFSSKDRREKFASLVNGTKEAMTDLTCLLSMLSTVIANGKTLDTKQLIATIILDPKAPAKLAQLEKYDLIEYFWAMVLQITGFPLTPMDKTLANLQRHILVTDLLTYDICKDDLPDERKFMAKGYEQNCKEIINYWLTSSEDSKNRFHLMYSEHGLASILSPQLQQIPLNLLAKIDFLPNLDEIILHKLCEAIEKNDFVDPKNIAELIKKRRTNPFYQKVANIYDYISTMLQFKEELDTVKYSIHQSQPQILWKKYTESLYKFDTYYRKIQLYYQLIIKDTSMPDITDSIKNIHMDIVEPKYRQGFLDEIGRVWSDIALPQMANQSPLPTITQQKSFYANYIAPKNDRTFVIISDAMRYEVARELAEQIELSELKGDIVINSMQGIFPTITEFGMAALLPHNKLTLNYTQNGTRQVRIDGKKTDSSNRESILQAANEKSVTIKYSDFHNATRNRRKELVKGQKVVYLYHDAIDAAGHEGVEGVAAACETAIAQIKDVIKTAINDLSIGNFIITADHGFLFNFGDLAERDKVPKKSLPSDCIDLDKRYALVKSSTETTQDYLYNIALDFDNPDLDLKGLVPYMDLRISMQGGGGNFVHGGLSLQEMVVPVIEFHYLRNNSSKIQDNPELYLQQPVNIRLILENKVIKQNNFNLRFYQQHPISNLYRQNTFKIYFVDEYNTKLCNVSTIIADSDSTNDNDRFTDLDLCLYEHNYDANKSYYLIIESADSSIDTQKIKFTMDINKSPKEFSIKFT